MIGSTIENREGINLSPKSLNAIQTYLNDLQSESKASFERARVEAPSRRYEGARTSRSVEKKQLLDGAVKKCTFSIRGRAISVKNDGRQSVRAELKAVKGNVDYLNEYVKKMQMPYRNTAEKRIDNMKGLGLEPMSIGLLK